MVQRHSFTAARGSILILVFFVLTFSSLFSLSIGYMVRQKISVIARLESHQKLRSIADAAVQKAISVYFAYKDDNPPCQTLNQSWSKNPQEFKKIKMGGGEYSVFYATGNSFEKGTEAGVQYGLVDEERKINLNTIKSKDILQRLFQECGGLTKDDARAVADSVMDWRDEDDDTSLLGAEGRYYKGMNPQYMPRNKKLETLQELHYVKGMTPELYKKILPYVTIHSSGYVNLNTVSRPVLLSLGCEPVICDKMLAFRRGRDQKEGTEDDEQYKDVSTVSLVLASSGYLYDNELNGVDTFIQSGLLAVKSENFSVQAVAALEHSKQRLNVRAIFDEKGTIKWLEEKFVTSS